MQYSRLEGLIRRLGLKESLTSLGLKASDIDWLAKNALKVSAPAINNHPIAINEEAIREIFRQSL